MRSSWCTVSKRACSTGMPTGCESTSACPRDSTALRAEDRAFWQRVRLLRSAVAGPGSRLEQIVDWCGGEAFDGALVLDECHVGTGSPFHRLAVLNPWKLAWKTACNIPIVYIDVLSELTGLSEQEAVSA